MVVRPWTPPRAAGPPGQVRTRRTQPPSRDLCLLHAPSPARERPLSGSSMLLVHKVIEDGHPHGLKYHADATCSESVAEIK